MIQLNDGKPWFRRWMWIGAKPITEEGRLVTRSAQGLCLLAGVVALLTDGQSPWIEIALAVALVAWVATVTIIFFKMEGDF